MLALTPQDSQTLTVGGATFSRTGIQFADTKPETVKAVGAALSVMESCVDWGWSDYLPFALRAHAAPKSEKAKGGGNASQQIEMGAIAEYAEMHGRDAHKLQERARVGAFFPPAARRAGLSFAHHAEAWAGAGGNIEQAGAWLARAEEQSWSAAQLRAHIRSATAAQQAPVKPAPPAELASERDLAELEIVSARRLREAKTIDANRARAMLNELRNTVALVSTLQKLAEK